MDTNRTYSVYTHKVVTDDNGPMWYVGVTKNIKQRWHPSLYKHCNISLGQYIDKYGWDNIEHRVVANGLDKETAYKLEDVLILMYRSADCCINKQRSGLLETNDKNTYQRKLYNQNQEYAEKQRKTQAEYYRNKRANDPEWVEQNLETKRKHYLNKMSTTEGKIYFRVKAFNRRHPDRMIETALEARDKYLQTGYIPDYVKNDDLIKEHNNNNNV